MKSNKQLLDFYTKVVNALGLIVDKEGFIKVRLSDGKESIIMTDGKPLVLPTKEQINSMVVVEDGKSVVTKTLFNPLKEDIVTGENAALHKARTTMSKMLVHRIAVIIDVLLRIASDKELQDKAPLEISTFLGSLKEARNTNVKQVVDEQTLSKFRQLFEKTIDELPLSKGFANIFTRKGGNVDGVRYNRVATLKFPIYHELKEMDPKEDKFHDIKLRKKDKVVFTKAFEYIIGDHEDKLALGSNDEQSPGFISMFMLYHVINDRLNEIIDNIKFADPEVESIRTEMDITMEEISSVGEYSKAINLVPDDNANVRRQAKITQAIVDERQKNKTPTGQVRRTNVKEIVNRINKEEQEKPVQQTQSHATAPAQTAGNTQNQSALDKILGRRPGGNVPAHAPNNPYMPAPAPQVRPLNQGMGYNTMQQPMYGNYGMQQPNYGYQQPNNPIVRPLN